VERWKYTYKVIHHHCHLKMGLCLSGKSLSKNYRGKFAQLNNGKRISLKLQES